MARILLVSSSGGHLDQLIVLLPALADHDVAFATFNKPDVVGKVGDHQIYPVAWPTNRNIRNLVRNLYRAFRCVRDFAPDVIVSSGAGPALPFFIAGKISGNATNVFLECYDRIQMPTLTARLVKPFCNLFIAQWESQLANWPRRELVGPSQ